MLNILVWFTRRSSEAQLSVDRDSLLRLQATPSTSVHCNNRRLPDNSKPSAISANPGNLSRRGNIFRFESANYCCIFQIISEFDRPGSFQPMKANYNKQKFEPTTEKSFVSGPPLGKQSKIQYTNKCSNVLLFKVMISLIGTQN